MSDASPPDPNFPRLTDTPFPAYRYAPGRHPHPVNDVGGHSRDRHLPDFGQEALRACKDWRSSPHYCYSVDLYNYAYWWEAHEGWEGLWRALDTDTPHRYALQAFIQVSAAHLQRFLEHPKGVDTLLRHARIHLDTAKPAGEVVFGVNIDHWWYEEVVPYFESPGEHPFPFLRPE